jgi:hypothetical protein
MEEKVCVQSQLKHSEHKERILSDMDEGKKLTIEQIKCKYENLEIETKKKFFPSIRIKK